MTDSTRNYVLIAAALTLIFVLAVVLGSVYGFVLLLFFRL